MKYMVLIRQVSHLWTLPSSGIRIYSVASSVLDEERANKKANDDGQWFTLPPFSPAINGSVLGKELSTQHMEKNHIHGNNVTNTTALKWVLKCCPQLQRSLIQKLFRLRQVRKEVDKCDQTGQVQACQLKRVGAKDSLYLGDRVFLPISVQIQEMTSKKQKLSCKEEETNFVRSFELYKDPAILVLNKPPGMPVQGGIGVKRSLDELAATCLKFDNSEPPRLVHRLDRDSSGILVMGRTHTSATLLHSIFREKTSGVLDNDSHNGKKILQRRYWALVIGSPARPRGMISAPLGKVLVDNGKSERITLINDTQNVSSQHAITEYRVISSSHGYTWLELSPLTGRKHQIRVHCAEVLGSPIVGDYKYGRLTHKNRKDLPLSRFENFSSDTSPKGKMFPFGLDLENGSISDQQPFLHLHCKHMILPNVSLALQKRQISSDCDLSKLDSLRLTAPLPWHMQRSWDILNS